MLSSDLYTSGSSLDRGEFESASCRTCVAPDEGHTGVFLERLKLSTLVGESLSARLSSSLGAGATGGWSSTASTCRQARWCCAPSCCSAGTTPASAPGCPCTA